MTQPDPISFLRCPDGHLEFGLIEKIHAAAIGVQHGFIHLQYGYQGNRNTGFGYFHIQEKWERVRQLGGLGFPNIESYCSAVAKNYSRICEGSDGRLVLVLPKDGFDLQIVVEWQEKDGAGFWTIITGIPKRVERGKELLKVVRTGGREPSPDVAKRPRFAPLSLPKKV